MTQHVNRRHFKHNKTFYLSNRCIAHRRNSFFFLAIILLYLLLRKKKQEYTKQ